MQQITISDLCLRAFEKKDAAAFAAMVRDTAMSADQSMDWCHPDYTEAQALEWFAVCAQERAFQSAYEFGIFNKESGELSGAAGINMIDRICRRCNLSYWVAPRWQGQGIATTVASALTQYAFSELQLFRVELVMAMTNLASRRVADKAGAQFEGLARHRLYLNGSSVDAAIYSLIPGEVRIASCLTYT